MRGRLLGFIVFIILSSGLSGQIAAAQSPDFIYSENKGHTISGAFLEFYRLSPNPKEIYGEPITEAFTDPRYNLLACPLFRYHTTSFQNME